MPQADGSGCTRGGGTPADGADPGDQLVDVEGLGDVVVRTGVERLDLVAAGGPPGQDDDGHGGPAAQVGDDGHPVEVGEAEVKDDDVGSHCYGFGEGLPAGVGGGDRVTAGGQVHAHRPHDLRVVVDEENPIHVAAAVCGRGRRGLLGGLGRLRAAGRRAQSKDHGESSAGGVVGGQRAPHRFGQAAGQGQTQPDTAAAVVAVAEALEGQEHGVAFGGGDAGTVVDDPQLDAVAVGAAGHARRDVPGAVAQGVGEQVDQDAFEQAGVGLHLREGVGDVEDDGCGAVGAVEGAGDRFVERDRVQGDADGVGLQAAHVQEVLDQGREPGEGLSGGRDQFGALFGGPGDRAGEAVDRGGRGGERGAQVVADGGEQGAAHPVGFGEGDRFGSLLD